MSSAQVVPERALPAAPQSERMILGQALVDPGAFSLMYGAIEADDFSTEKHRMIFSAMQALDKAGMAINRITVYEELRKRGEVEAVGGLSYLISLDDGSPQVPSLESYLRVVKEKATLRRTIYAAQSLMNRCLAAEDGAGEIISEAERALYRLNGETQQKHGQWVQPGEVMLGAAGGIQGFLRPHRTGSAIPTPWPALTDALSGGFREEELVIVAGRPSMGKSIVAMQIAHYCAANGWPAAVVSLEMGKDSLIHRLLCSIARVDYHRFLSGKLWPEEERKIQETAPAIEDEKLYIDDTGARTIPAITAALRKLVARERIQVLVVDHLQLMRGVGRHDSRRDELSEVVHSLKWIAKEFKIRVIVCCQLNRKCEDESRRPQLSDLAETGSIEQDADVVLFVHRWERYQKFRGHQEHRGTAEMLLAKQRNGPIGMVKMVFLGQYQSFEMMADSDGLVEGE